MAKELGYGHAEAFRTAVKTRDKRVHHGHGSGAEPGFLERMPVTPGRDATFTHFWEASRGWTGPTRSDRSPDRNM